MPLQEKRSTNRKDGTTSLPHAPPLLPIAVVSEENNVLVLHFEGDYIQSQMVLDDPLFLALAYTRAMVAFAVYKPDPRQIVLIGLGGGSIAKWCYHHHSKTRLTVVEINPHVIAVRDRFLIPPDDDRFRILCENGAHFVAETTVSFDVLLVDCFSKDSLPGELCSQAFYDNCKRVLSDSGLMVANICGEGRRNVLARIRRSFDGRVLLFPDKDGNTVVFASKGELLWPEGETAGLFRTKLRAFERKHNLGKAMAPAS